MIKIWFEINSDKLHVNFYFVFILWVTNCRFKNSHLFFSNLRTHFNFLIYFLVDPTYSLFLVKIIFNVNWKFYLYKLLMKQQTRKNYKNNMIFFYLSLKVKFMRNTCITMELRLKKIIILILKLSRYVPSSLT